MTFLKKRKILSLKLFYGGKMKYFITQILVLSSIVFLQSCSENKILAPDAPTLSSSSNGLKNLTLNWNLVPGATSYNLYYADDGVTFIQVGSSLSGTTNSAVVDISVHLVNWLNGSYKIFACNDGGCTQSNIVANTEFLTEDFIGYFKASNTETDDYFAYSLTLSADGNTLVLGASGEDSSATGVGGNQSDNSAVDSGAVYVYTRSGSTWSFEEYIKASNTETNDLFTYSLALSADGNTLVVSAPGESSNATGVGGTQSNNSASNSGAVYVYTRSGSTWSFEEYIKASNTETGDYFGSSLALSTDGNTLGIGAYYERSNATGVGGNQSDNSETGSGAVYVYTRSGSAWSFEEYIKASNTEANDNFAYFSLALSADGNTLVVGASGEDSNATGVGGDQSDNSASNSGAAYVYTRSGSTWSFEKYIKASNTETNDLFTYSLALSADGNTLVVSAPGESSNATGVGGTQSNNSASNSGAVFMF